MKTRTVYGVMKMRFSRSGIAAVLTAGSLLTAAAQQDTNLPPLETADFDTNAEPKVIQPAQINVSPALAEVVRLAQSGAGEGVILAYIQKAPAYEITGDEIIYLKDLGISDAVLKALVDRSQPGAAGAAVSAPVPAPTNAAPAVTAPLTPPEDVGEFYQPLTPYGSWVEVAPYGWCWQPTVAVVYGGWQPYCDNGYWLWSDSGWYWHSYYSWGWAPFHYGRWFHHPRRGWCWSPDRVWGPSWVCWRNSPGYAGWAPLPPGARFSVGIGWTFRGRAVSSSFGFGLASSHFAFVSTAHFADHHVAVRRLPPREVNVVFNKTTVVNNYVVGSGNRVINRGVDRGRIEAATGTRIREVAVRELPRDRTRAVLPDRVTKLGKSEVIYRPGPKIDMSRNSPSPAAERSPVASRREAPPRQEGRGTPPAEPGPTPRAPAEGNRPADTAVAPPRPGTPAPKAEPRATPPDTHQAPLVPGPSRPANVPAPSERGARPPASSPRMTPPSHNPSERAPAPAPSQPRSQPRSRQDDRR